MIRLDEFKERHLKAMNTTQTSCVSFYHKSNDPI